MISFKLPPIKAMNKIFLLTVFFFFYFPTVKAQSAFDIIFPQNSAEDNRCGYFNSYFKNKPKEVGFSIVRENDKLYFQATDTAWAARLFKKSGDGIAIDVVVKSRYDCDKEVEESQIRGTVLKPVYAKQLVRGLKPSLGNRFRTFVGKVPEKLKGQALEFNILFLNNKTLCRYQRIYNLESYPWDLLDMGVYLDSLTFKSKRITNTKDKFITKYKKLKFVIPFQKNKSEYLPEDIKPLYDSLKLTDYNIKKINIKAYSSIEGSLDRNLELQKLRGNSIAKSLQSFQKPNVISEISSSENWVEFLNDVTKSKYKNLKELSKKEIKQKVIGAVSKELEVYLKNHRKAVIILDLEKKDKYKEMTTGALISTFNKLVKQDNIEEALIVQNSIFEKLKEENSPDKLRQLNVPKQARFVPLLNKNSMFKYILNLSYAKIAFDELKTLEKLDPKNEKLKYNLVVLKFIIWKNNWVKIKASSFKNEILKLRNYKIKESLIDRMLVNYHIVKAEKNMKVRKYDEKDFSVTFILNTYKNFNLSNYDYLSLAQFLTYYANIDDSIDLLDEKVRTITVDEDLLFYYLNLTITKKQNVAASNYRTIMLNAINMNKERFCKLFNASLDSGVTFQLLENEYLRKTYCENCKKE
jgi:outer membrane protein OmpA-like peptidoglycan-associated protein